MHRRSGRVLLIVASGLCAGLLWGSNGLTNLFHRPFSSHTSIPTGASSDAEPRGWAGVAPLSTLPMSSKQPYSMTGPELLSDPTTVRARSIAVSDVSSDGVHPRHGADALLVSMSPASSEQQPYSMSAPEFLSDPAAAKARSIAVGDVSGDGRDDLVFLSLQSAPDLTDNPMAVYVAYQRDDGRLDPAVKIAAPGTEFTYQLLIADLDRDGVGDIITAIANGVMVLRSNADGTFRPNPAYFGNPGDLLVTDVDRDGHLDILVDTSNTSATVVYGDGRGGIDQTSTLPLPASAVRTVGDVTGDGLDDLILGTIFSRPLQEFHVYPALASGGYDKPIVLYRPIDANQTGSLAVGDFNADGRGDLALEEAKDEASLHLYFQDPQGSLASSLDIARHRGSGVLIATDLNGDRRTDLAIAHSGWGYIGYYLQTDTGFTPETLIEAYQYMGRVNYFAAGDLNHDGCGDLAVSRWTQSPVLMYGQGCAPLHMDAPDCRYPAAAVEGPGLKAADLTSSLVRQHNGGVSAIVRQGLTPSAGAGFGRTLRR